MAIQGISPINYVKTKILAPVRSIRGFPKRNPRGNRHNVTYMFAIFCL
jgi:hypothetical protein